MRKDGFTLLEVLIATVMLTVGVASLLWAFSMGMYATTDVEDIDLALNIARAKMEEVKNTAYGSLADSGPTADANFSDFNVTVDVDEGANPMQVDVTVAWNAKGGSASVDLTTLVVDY